MPRSLYERDFAEWAEHNAQLLRHGHVDAADLKNIAEELADLGRRQRREMESRVTVVLAHLLRMKVQGVRKRAALAAIIVQRSELHSLLRDSPSLRPKLERTVADAYPTALEVAIAETGFDRIAFPKQCPFTAEQVLDPNFRP